MYVINILRNDMQVPKIFKNPEDKQLLKKELQEWEIL
jgi:hypothetical protein